MKKNTLVIAEIGVNHNGDVNLAKKMVEVAKNCGADIVKFQTAHPEKIISKFAPKADYQKKTTGEEESQLEMVKKVTLPFEAYKEINKYCNEQNIEFMSTPFDIESIDFLDDLGQRRWKIPSGEVTNLPYLIKIAKTGYPIIMSTGMCDISEIESAIEVLKSNGCGEITLLHCTTEYPAPISEINLKAMITLRNHFNVTVGYSDHTKGIDIPIAAVAMGAEVIEKHFTLDKNMDGPDHKASLEPEELKKMIEGIRNVDIAMGDGVKKATESEKKNKLIARKSIVAAKAIKKGELLSEDNLTTKRPGTGISPMKWFDVVGTVAYRNYEEDELIEL